jgi:hypothetical protein
MKNARLRSYTALLIALLPLAGCSQAPSAGAAQSETADDVDPNRSRPQRTGSSPPEGPSNGNELRETAKIAPQGAIAFDQVGAAIAASGSTVVLGAPGDDGAGINAGAAYVFTFHHGQWIQAAKLKGKDIAAHDGFGLAVAMHEDLVLVGAQSHDGVGEDAGAAYLFRRGNDGRWGQIAKFQPAGLTAGDRFGHSVAMDGRICVIGAIGRDGTCIDSGAVYIVREGTGGWDEFDLLTPKPEVDHQMFGFAAALSGDTLVVGAYGDGPQVPFSGAAYVYRRSGEGWRPQSKLRPGRTTSLDEFGRAVSVSGNVVVVGARGDAERGPRAGAAYVFENEGAGWKQTAKLLPENLMRGDSLGCAVSASADFVVAGSHFRDDVGVCSGAAYAFRKSNGNWLPAAKLVNTDGVDAAEFGATTAVADNFIVIGALHDAATHVSMTAAGACYVYDADLLRKRVSGGESNVLK